MYKNEDEEDLRVEIFQLKKQLSKVLAENHLLKVKVRKLQNEVTKRDKQMESVLDPRKSPTAARKIMYEKSASFILNLKEKNDELLQSNHEKDVIIKRLQNHVEIMKLYSTQRTSSAKRHFISVTELENKFRQSKISPASGFKENFSSTSSFGDNTMKKMKKNRSLSWTPGLREAESTLMENITFEMQEEAEEEAEEKKGTQFDLKEQYKSLSKEHLLSIIENLKNNQRYSPRSRQTSSRKSSPESDLERIELLCESPHEEIQQLHLHFIDMISEVDYLKSTITQLQNNQEKTENVLKKKDTNISKLAKEIKNLKRPKSKNFMKIRNTNEMLARVYSASNKSIASSKSCCQKISSDNSSEKLSNHSTRKKANSKIKKDKTDDNNSRVKVKNKLNKMRDVTTQVEDLLQGLADNSSSNTISVFIEKAAEKSDNASEPESTEREDEYVEEEFEDECENTE